VLEHRQIRLGDGEALVRILLDAEQSEAVTDLLGERYAGQEHNRVVIMAVDATLPRDEPEPTKALEQTAPEVKSPERISREELYEDIKDAAQCTRVYLAMVVLSTIVAAVGLYYDSVAIIIGAMVIAPLLGPNMALSLGTTLGDLPLLQRAIMTALAGIACRDHGVVSVHRHVGACEFGFARTGVGLCRRGGVIAAIGDLWATAGQREFCLGNGRTITVFGEPDQHKPCRSDDVSGARHSSDNLVGERTSRKSHEHCTQAMGGNVGGIGRPDPAVSKGLNRVREKLCLSIFIYLSPE
jgi:hypothetical protein